MKEETGFTVIVIILCLMAVFLCACGGTGGERKEDPAEEPVLKGSPEDSSRTIIYMDFENGEMEGWSVRRLDSGRNRGLFMEVVPATEYNHSAKVLYYTPPEGRSGGEMLFDFRENGIDPFPLARETQMAWSWNVSRRERMNGAWFYLGLVDTREDRYFLVRAANAVEYMHDCIVTYDPPRCWCHHSQPVYDFVWKRYGPFKKGDIIVKQIGLAVYRGEGVEVWIDNIWVGQGEPPEYVNTISDSARINVNEESRVTEFSYAFINHDRIPDRVEVYRERADIFINPHLDESPGLTEGRVRNVRITPDITLKLGEQRGDAAVTPADLDGDGHADLLFQFDDLHGNICFRNDYLKGSFKEVRVGALYCPGEHGSGTAVADIDGDTDLDIFMYNGFRRHGNFGGVRMFRNERRFQFTDWTEESYLLSEGSFGGIFAGLNNDPFVDLFINYKPHDSGREMVNLNNGTGRFNPSAVDMNAYDSTHYNVCTAADFDNDGDLDIYCIADFVNGSKAIPRCMMLRNEGGGNFADVTAASGTGYRGRSGGVVAGDFNLDGLVDIYLVSSIDSCIRNRCNSESVLYLNQGNFRFQRTERYSYLKIKEQVRGLAALDFDLDGDLDIVALTAEDERLLVRENIGIPDNFLEVRLRGKGGNRAALGGKVYIYEAGHLNEKERLLGCREISLEGCRETKVPPVAHFGLGTQGKVDLKVIFPPENGREAVVKTSRNVEKGSFLDICQSESFPGRIFCGHHMDYIRSSFIYSIFRFPLWLFSFLTFSALVSAGVWIREVSGAAWRSAGRMAVLILALTLSVLLLYRAPSAGALVIVAAAVITMFSYRVEGVLRKVIISDSRKDKLEELLFDDLSQAIHTEKKFSFLGELARPDTKLNSEQIQKDFRALDNIVSAMRMISPADPGWRIIRDEIEEIRLVGRRLLGREKRDTGSPDMRIFRHSLQRLNSMLEDYRWKLRTKYSVNFLDEWEELKREYREQMKEEGIDLVEEFNDDISGRSAHLLPEEFRHIFKNLFDNSIYALRDSPQKRIMVNGWLEADLLVLQWRDTGPGLPAGMEDEIFVTPVSSGKPGGMGEGCYQSRRIMNRRGGRIRAEATSGGSGVEIIMKIVLV
ncbi:MAG: hypothetical protein GF417_08505 [Candidatus Latescibacteria bacterium]|nr:hypothetical protein [bacterium]MBD3424462.1 hypothetical protein [Candidatus Latescibacterota bacterium]